MREKLLLRQLDVLNRAPDNKIDFSEIQFQTEQEEAVLEMLRNYGVYQNIDSFLPYLENENEDNNFLFEKSFYDPIDNKKLSESIINLTLRESQNLITRSSDLVTSVSDKLKLDPVKGAAIDKTEDLHDNEAGSIKPKSSAKVKEAPDDERKLKRNDTTTSSKKKTLKNISNLTLNNCGGSIVLKNISHLTINTCKPQPSPKASDPPAPAKPCKTSKSCDGTFYQCDFYERLISENEVLKRSIVNQSLCTTYPDPIAQLCKSPPPVSKENDDGTYSINSENTTTVSSVSEEEEDGLPAKQISFDPAIEEITTRTILSDSLLNHPPMIQCWLNKMLLETETEAQNIADLLEISNII